MKVVEVRNVHEGLQIGMSFLQQIGIKRETRFGPVLVAPYPVTTKYENPTERVLFWPNRDANPFFHFMEGLWMIAGRNDVAWISQFAGSMKQFSDDGETFHGAYGYRWINHFAKEVYTSLELEDFPGAGGTTYVPFNQLEMVAEMLKANPNERRCVVNMWDPEVDLGRDGKDLPCNTQILFKINVYGKLDMTVYNRSNDIIWGCYGANAVHMSMLHEFMASWIGVSVGYYYQVSNDWHGYDTTMEKHNSIIEDNYYQPYHNEVEPYPMVSTEIQDWIADLQMFMQEGPVPGFKDRFFRKVVSPMWNSWFAWKGSENQSKKQRIENALVHANQIAATDWKRACVEWLERRK